MTDIALNTAEIDALLVRLAHDTEPDPFVATLGQVGAYLGTMAEGYARSGYPPAPSGRKQPFVSDKQRRYFFAALKQGDIKVPRVRTGFLGNSITHQVDSDEIGVTVHVGTSLSYAPYVIGEQQSRFHAQTGWFQLPKLLADHASDFRAATAQQLQHRIGGQDAV